MIGFLAITTVFFNSVMKKYSERSEETTLFDFFISFIPLCYLLFAMKVMPTTWFDSRQ